MTACELGLCWLSLAGEYGLILCFKKLTTLNIFLSTSSTLLYPASPTYIFLNQGSKTMHVKRFPVSWPRQAPPRTLVKFAWPSFFLWGCLVFLPFVWDPSLLSHYEKLMVTTKCWQFPYCWKATWPLSLQQGPPVSVLAILFCGYSSWWKALCPTL